MPQIPTYDRQVGLGPMRTGARAETGPGAEALGMIAAGRGVQDAGAGLGILADAETRRQDGIAKIKEAKALSSASAQLDELALAAEQDPDYAGAAQRFQQQAARIKETHSKSLTDPLSQDRFAQNFDKTASGKHIEVKRSAWKKMGDDALATADQVIESEAAASARAVNEVDRAAIAERVAGTLRGFENAGLIGPNKSGDMYRAYRQKTASAQVLNDGTAMGPDIVAERLLDPKFYPDLDPVQRARLTETMNSRSVAVMNRQDRQAEKTLREQGDAAARELNDLQADGKLTRGAIDKRKSVLSPAEHRAYLKSLDPKTDDIKDNRGAVARLEPLLDTPDAMNQVGLAYDNKELSTPTYRAMMEKSRALQRDDQPQSPYKSGRAFLATALDPGQLSSDPIIRQPLAIAQARALGDFDAFALANKGLTYEQAQDKAGELLGRYQNVAFQDMKLSLPAPYRFGGAKSTVTVDSVAASRASVIEQLDAGTLSKADAARELKNLDVWERITAQAAAQPKAKK